MADIAVRRAPGTKENLKFVSYTLDTEKVVGSFPRKHTQAFPMLESRDSHGELWYKSSGTSKITQKLLLEHEIVVGEKKEPTRVSVSK